MRTVRHNDLGALGIAAIAQRLQAGRGGGAAGAGHRLGMSAGRGHRDLRAVGAGFRRREQDVSQAAGGGSNTP